MAEAPFTGLTASIKIGTPVPSGSPSLTLLGYASGCDLTLEEDIIERYVDDRYQYLKFRSSVNKMFNKYYKTAEFMAIWSRV